MERFNIAVNDFGVKKSAYGTCLFTARKRILRRLCFYRCLSVYRGGVHGGGGHVWWGCAWWLGSVHGGGGGGGMRGGGGHAWQGGMHATHTPPADIAGYSQRAGRTYPTGMHSCLRILTREQ